MTFALETAGGIDRLGTVQAGGAFGKPMSGPGTRGGTRGLLDGAVQAGFVPDESVPQRTDISVPWLIRKLARDYWTTQATPGLLAEAAPRLRDRGLEVLAVLAERKVREETGHDRLALKDLAGLGLDAQAVVGLIRPPGAEALTGSFASYVRSDFPERCFGYAYCFERLALLRGADAIERVQALVKPGVDVTRCLRVHSAVGSDADHVEELVDAVAGLAAEVRVRIAQSTFETATLMADVPRLDAGLSDEAIVDILGGAGVALPS